jgi:hypothetical protein
MHKKDFGLWKEQEGYPKVDLVKYSEKERSGSTSSLEQLDLNTLQRNAWQILMQRLLKCYKLMLME